MSLRRRVGFPGLFAAFLFSVLVPCFCQAQNETAPKADLFAGYQWLSPKGKVPIAGTFNPVQGQTLQDLSEGFGLAFGYNFHPNFALEGDYGGGWKNGFNVNTYSVGPRFTLRTDNMNYFIHTLVGL